MKKIALVTTVLLSTFFITACGDDTEDENTKGSAEQAKQQEHHTNIESQAVLSNTDVADKISQLDYEEFDFDIMYEGSEFEGQLKEDDDGFIEAEFYDPFNDINQRGQAAFDTIFPILQDLEITKNMTDKEAIATAIEALNIPDNFLKAELEITFSDGAEKEYEIKNLEKNSQ